MHRIFFVLRKVYIFCQMHCRSSGSRCICFSPGTHHKIGVPGEVAHYTSGRTARVIYIESMPAYRIGNPDAVILMKFMGRILGNNKYSLALWKGYMTEMPWGIPGKTVNGNMKIVLVSARFLSV